MDRDDTDKIGTILRKVLRCLEDIQRDGKTSDYLMLEEIERNINQLDS